MAPTIIRTAGDDLGNDLRGGLHLHRHCLQLLPQVLHPPRWRLGQGPMSKHVEGKCASIIVHVVSHYGNSSTANADQFAPSYSCHTMCSMGKSFSLTHAVLPVPFGSRLAIWRWNRYSMLGGGGY